MSVGSGIHPVQYIGLSVPICSKLFNNDLALPEIVKNGQEMSGNGSKWSINGPKVVTKSSGNCLKWPENVLRCSGNDPKITETHHIWVEMVRYYIPVLDGLVLSGHH